MAFIKMPRFQIKQFAVFIFLIAAGLGFLIWAQNQGINEIPPAINYAPNFWFDSEEKYYPTNPLDFYYDGNLNEIPGKEAVGKYDNLSLDEKLENFRVFYKIDNQTDEIIYQYWLFYVFNDSETNEHYGDWESVFVFVDRNTGKINRSIGSAHIGNITKIFFANDEIFHPINSHVNLLIEKGSHANCFDKNNNGLFDRGIDSDNAYNSYCTFGFADWSETDKVNGLKAEYINSYYNLIPLGQLKKEYSQNYSEDRPLITAEKSPTLGSLPVTINFSLPIIGSQEYKFYALPGIGGSAPDNAWAKAEYENPEQVRPITFEWLTEKTTALASDIKNSFDNIVDSAKGFFQSITSNINILKAGVLPAPQKLGEAEQTSENETAETPIFSSEESGAGDTSYLDETQEELDDLWDDIDIITEEIYRLNAPQQSSSREQFSEDFLSNNNQSEKIFENGENDIEAQNNETEEEQPIEITVAGTQKQEPQICNITAGAVASQDKIILNELAWMGTAVSSNNEWIELKNISASPINLKEWQLIDKTLQIKAIFPENYELLPDALFLLERTDDGSVPHIAADLTYQGALNDTNEILYLFDQNCQLQDKAEANPNWPAGDKNAKKSMERSDDFSWHTFSGEPQQGIYGTPKQENSSPSSLAQEQNQPDAPAESPAPPAKILITEIQIEDDQTSQDFIELYNPNDFDVFLKNYRLVKRAKTSAQDTTIKSWSQEPEAAIAAKNYFLWASSTDENYPAVINADSWTKQNISSDNGIALRAGAENTGQIIDALGWGDFNNVLFEGSAFLENPGAAQSLARKQTADGYQDTNSNSADFELQTPTPKAQNQTINQDEPEENPSEQEPVPVQDTTPPLVNFNSFEPVQINLIFTLSWSAEDPVDNATPSGIDAFYLYYTAMPSIDGVTPPTDGVVLQYQNQETQWQDWQNDLAGQLETASSNLILHGKDGYSYNFFIKARDAAGNESGWQVISTQIKLPAPSPGQVVINEIAWMGTKASASDEWIELYNKSNSALDLTGWKLKSSDSNGPELLLSGTILAKTFYLIERTDDSATSKPADWRGPFGNGLSNTACEVLSLYDANDNLIDQTPCLASGEWPAGKASPDYISMERINPKLSGSDPDNWADNNIVVRNGLDADGNPINGTPRNYNSVYRPLAPNQITDLIIALENTQNNTIALTWSSPEDLDTNQESLFYDIRYLKNEELTEGNWETAAVAANPPNVGEIGSAQILIIPDLSYNSVYYLAVKTFDGGNYSPLSNVASYQIPSAITLSPWPMFMANLQRNGQSDYSGPESNASILWAYNKDSNPTNSLNNPLYTSPIIGPEGGIYTTVIFPTSKKGVLALNSDGSKKWSQQDGQVNYSLTLTSDNQLAAGDKKSGNLNGTVYEKEKNILRAKNQEGEVLWEREFELIDPFNPPRCGSRLPGVMQPAISADGNLYVVAEGNSCNSNGDSEAYLYLITPTNEILWKISLGGYRPTLPAVSKEGNAYVFYLFYGKYSWQPTLYLKAVSSAGEILWTKSFGLYNPPPPIIDEKENLYLVLGRTAYALDKNGQELWRLFLQGSPVDWQLAEQGLALGKDGTLYLSGRGAILALK